MKTNIKKTGAAETAQPKAGKQAPVNNILSGYGKDIQRKTTEEEEPVQGKFETTQLQSKEEEEPLQKKSNKTGLPDNLKSGVEHLSGYSLDDVKVHYNSSRPAQLQAHAYAQGTEIHVGPGQEKHLPHEAWHVVQQKQGRVKPTMQMKDKVNINDDAGLEKEADVMGGKALSNEAKMSSDIAQPKFVSGNIVQQKRMTELHLADINEDNRIVNDIEIFGNRPDWGSEMDKLRGEDEQLRHERAWDELKYDLKAELTGSKYGFGTDYTVGEVADYLANQGYNHVRGKRNVENVIDTKLEAVYRDKTNVWSGEKQDNEARGRLYGTLKGYFDKTDMGPGVHFGATGNSVRVINQFWQDAEFTEKNVNADSRIFGGLAATEKISLIYGKNGIIALSYGNINSSLSNAFIWRESTQTAYAIDPSFNPDHLLKLKDGTGITSKNSYYGDLKLNNPDQLAKLYAISGRDANPLTNSWSEDIAYLDMVRINQAQSEIDNIIGGQDGHLPKSKKFKIRSYKDNIDGIRQKFKLFRKKFESTNTAIPPLFGTQERQIRRLVRKINRNIP